MHARTWVKVPRGAKDVVTTALERGFSTFVIDPADEAAFRTLGRIRLLTLKDGRIQENGETLGPRVTIRTPEEQAGVLAQAGKSKLLLVDTHDWKIIPFENLIAACQGRTELVAPAKTAEEAKLLLTTLEVGVDHVLLEPDTPADVIDLAQGLANVMHADVQLVPARITRVKPLGLGDRVCLDTTSLLRVGEGLLVGSSAQALLLVASEAEESGYVAARPFRVNAGPVHAYTLLPDGKTKYLSELAAGDELLAVDADGKTRRVVLGRVKIEQRPLLLLEAEANGRRVNTILQNAETIRLVTPQGTKSVAHLTPGDEVMLRMETGGRHFGTLVKETITER